MEPLPALPELLDQSPVYTPAVDSFASLLGSDSSTITSLLDGAATDQNTATDGLAAAGGALDTIDATISDVWAVFDGLSVDLNSVDLTPDIATYQALDTSLLNSLDSWSPDFTVALSALTKLLVGLFGPSLQFLYDFIGYVQGQLQAAVNSLYAMIMQLANSLAFAFSYPLLG